MATILTNLRSRVQQNVAEPITTTGWFTPAAVTDWLNAGFEMVFLKILALNPDYFPPKTFLLSYVAQQQEYGVGSAVPFEFRRLEVTDQSQPYFLSEIPIYQRNMYSVSGEPHSFYWVLDYSGADPVLKIGLVPKPDRSATNNVTGWYIPYPRKLSTEGDYTDLPQEAEELAILWASILAYRSDQRSAQSLQDEFNFRLANLLSFVGRGRAGGPQYVNYVDDY